VEEVYNLSTYCLSEVGESLDRCKPEINFTLKHFAGIWCIINGILGFSGNLLTLLAIPYAAWHKKLEPFFIEFLLYNF
jgi:hypothetical protein